MPKSASTFGPELVKAYDVHEQQQRIQTGKVASALVVLLMPAGLCLDYFVYPESIIDFLWIRLACSALVGIVWLLHTVSFGRRHFRFVNSLIPALPSLAIAWMIYKTEGPASPYYAGLNLILLAISVLVHWNVVESMFALGVVMVLYLTACFLQPGPIKETGILVNNVYFLTTTGLVVVTGNFFFDRLRRREFALNYELERNQEELEESNQKLKELDQIKGRFFANISHELRTPLTLMISPLETILARHARTLDQDAVSLLQTMHSNGLRLLKLINDLLDLVRLDSGVMQARREPLALEPFLQGMASAARQVAEDKRINLVVTVAADLGVVMLDRDKMEKIVLNLQFNALKFTPAGGRVELRADKEGEELVLRVSDTGIGIPSKDLPNVFGRFFQVDSSSRRKFQGVGIGLALVKEFVELHGGTVAVESIEGQGTTFTARMPWIQADPNAVPAAASVPQALPALSQPGPETNGESAVAAGSTVSSQEWLSDLYHRANLFGGPSGDKVATKPETSSATANGHPFTALVADDQPDMLRFIKSELAAHYNVIAVSDGQQAVDQATAHTPDIVLLDMMMPEKDGMQACREIRAAPAIGTVPIILITAHVDEETKINALRAGASDFLPKPFSTTELHVRVKNLVESYDVQRKLSRQKTTLESTIEQLKDTETQLVQSEKLASLGRLSAGIIHEINNPLNFAATGLFTLRAKARLIPDGERDEYADTLKDVEEGIQRVKSIVSDLRTFTHAGETGGDEVNVADAVNSALRFLSQEWRNKVEIRIHLTDGLTIWGDKNKLIQVLINLVQNSLDAIRAKEFKDEKPAIVIAGRVDRGLNLLSVRDNGVGIDPKVRDKIFDPFFTTKDIGEGMGLGLSICYRIVRSFGGQILVQSDPGKSCEFTLEFPVTPPQCIPQP
jgi:signal transduction histidine kinase